MSVTVVLYVEGHVSLGSSILSGSYNLSASSYIKFRELWGEVIDRDIPFRTKRSKASHSLYIVRLWVTIFIPISAWGRFSGYCWARRWSTSVARDYTEMLCLAWILECQHRGFELPFLITTFCSNFVIVNFGFKCLVLICVLPEGFQSL